MSAMHRGLLIVSLLSIQAQALRKPQPERNVVDQAMLARAQSLIDAAQGDERIEVEKKAADLAKLESLFWQARYDSERKELALKIEAAEAMLRLAKYFQNEAYNKAAHIVAKLYDIVPPDRVRKSVMPEPFKDAVATWMIVVGEPEGKRVIDKNGDVHVVEPEDTAAEAASFYDGTLRLHHSAFDRGIGYLAATLYHERVHFDQHTTTGVGGRLNRHQREVKAYEAELENAGLFGLTPEEAAELSRRRENNAMGLTPIAWAPGQQFRARSNDDHGPAISRSKFPDLDAELALIRIEAEQIQDEVDAEFADRQGPSRRVDSAPSGEAGGDALSRLESSAQECGFSIAAVGPDGPFQRITVLDERAASLRRFGFRSDGDLVAARTAFVLMRACIDEHPVGPCNSSLSEVSLSQWEGGWEFWGKVVPVSGNHLVIGCVHDLYRFGHPGSSYFEVLAQIKENSRRRSDELQRDSDRRRGQPANPPTRGPRREGDDESRAPGIKECMERDGGRCIRWRR